MNTNAIPVRSFLIFHIEYIFSIKRERKGKHACIIDKCALCAHTKYNYLNLHFVHPSYLSGRVGLSLWEMWAHVCRNMPTKMFGTLLTRQQN